MTLRKFSSLLLVAAFAFPVAAFATPAESTYTDHEFYPFAPLSADKTPLTLKAKQYKAMADRCFAEHHLDYSLGYIDLAIAASPKSAYLHDQKATLYNILDREEENLKETNKAVALCPQDAKYRMHRACALNNLRRYKEAIVEVDKILTACPNAPSILMLKAAILLDDGQYTTALAAGTKFLKLKPRSQSGHFIRGRAYRHLGKLDEAEKDFKDAIAIAPLYSGATCELSIVYALKHDYSKAISVCDDLISRSKLSIGPYAQKALYEMILSNNSAAISDFKHAIGLYEWKGVSLCIKNSLLAAICYKRMGDNKSAEEMLRIAKAHSTTDKDLAPAMAALNFMLEDLTPGAGSHLTEPLTISVNEDQTVTNAIIGSWLLASGKKDAALPFLKFAEANTSKPVGSGHDCEYYMLAKSQLDNLEIAKSESAPISAQ